MVPLVADMARSTHQAFLPPSLFPPNHYDMGIPLLYSHSSDDSENGGGGGGSYSQSATSGFTAAPYATASDGQYVAQTTREQSRTTRPSRLLSDHGQDEFDFSTLPTGQPIGYQQSQGAVGVYTTSTGPHGSREPQLFFTNDNRNQWRGSDRSPPTNPLVPEFYRQHNPHNQGQTPFQLHGQRHIYTDTGRSNPYPSSSSRSAGSVSPVIKSGQIYLPIAESPHHQPIGDWLRENAGLTPGRPVTLWSLPDPPPGARPNVTYKVLVSLAIWGSREKRLSLQDIYTAIEERFPYYKNLPDEVGRDGKSGGKKWQRSVRHNLSLESIFYNEGRDISEPGKGGYWSLTNRNGYGQKRERKRKGKGSSNSSRDSLHSKNDDDEEFDDDDDDGDATDDHRPGSSRGRHSRGSSSSPQYSSPSAMPPSAFSSNSGVPTFGQSSFPAPARSRHHPPQRPGSVPVLNNVGDPDLRVYPTRPSTVPIPMYGEHGHGHGYHHHPPTTATPGQLLGQSPPSTGFTYDQLDAQTADGNMRRALRSDKGKRRAP